MADLTSEPQRWQRWPQPLPLPTFPDQQPAMEPDVPSDTSGLAARFFENAFEWHNMAATFYPYFWGKKPRWIPALNFTDPDPQFASFLRAGACRVQVPIRRGFERAMAHYCQHGEIWEGRDDPPLVEDELFLPVIQEILDAMELTADGTKPEETTDLGTVMLPTSLVLLQDLSEIQNIIDPLTGRPTSLGPPPGDDTPP